MSQSISKNISTKEKSVLCERQILTCDNLKLCSFSAVYLQIIHYLVWDRKQIQLQMPLHLFNTYGQNLHRSKCTWLHCTINCSENNCHQRCLVVLQREDTVLAKWIQICFHGRINDSYYSKRAKFCSIFGASV